MNEKAIIYMITAIIDLSLLIIILTQNLNIFDKIFIITMFICHVVFYYSLHYNIKYIINILHYILFIALSIAIIIKNKYLLSLCLIVLITIQFLWIICKDCILNRISYIKHGYSELISIFTLLITIIICIKIGYIFKD